VNLVDRTKAVTVSSIGLPMRKFCLRNCAGDRDTHPDWVELLLPLLLRPMRSTHPILHSEESSAAALLPSSIQPGFASDLVRINRKVQVYCSAAVWCKVGQVVHTEYFKIQLMLRDVYLASNAEPDECGDRLNSELAMSVVQLFWDTTVTSPLVLYIPYVYRPCSGWVVQDYRY